MKNKLKAYGTVEIVLKDQHGNVKATRELENMIVGSGLAHIASRILGVTQNVISHLAVGTGTNAESLANTALQAEAARAATTPTNVTTTINNDTVQHVATVPAGSGTGAITEAGLFNAAAAGVMLNRIVFAAVNKGALDTLTITWKIKIA